MMHFRALRVINEDFVAASQGFGTHPHDNMEIITYVISGQLAHKDSMGNGRTLNAGEVQTMSAGTGITHSEFNPADAPVHLYQMWILPDTKGIKPAYSEWYPKNLKAGWNLIASGNGREGSTRIQRDTNLYLAKPAAGEVLELPLRADRYGWLQVATGEVKMGEQTLKAGDAASFSQETGISITASQDSQLLFYDLD